MTQVSIWGSFMKRTRSRKYHATVPLNLPLSKKQQKAPCSSDTLVCPLPLFTIPFSLLLPSFVTLLPFSRILFLFRKKFIKGPCQKIFNSVFFFIKQLLLVSLDTLRKDFEFFPLFEEVLVFVIDSPVYSPPGSRP
jgi:hypothetical protein